MGNLFQRLFSNNSGEPGCKRPFAKHNKVNLNESNNNHNGGSKSKSHQAAIASEVADFESDQSVLFRKSFKSPSVHNIHSVYLNERTDNDVDVDISHDHAHLIDDDSLQSISQESPSSPRNSQKRPVSNEPDPTAQPQKQPPHENVQTEPELPQPASIEQPANPEHSPFQRDFQLPSHQPLVSLEKSRPRRSNIRRSSRMHTSMGKGDNVSRPQQHVLSSVPSFIADDDSEHVASMNHSEQSGHIQFRHHDSADNNESSSPDNRRQSAANQSIVDEMAPNERHKVAKSRISQMLIKQQQLHQQHKQMSPVTESDGVVVASESNGFVLNTNYVPVYESIDNYGHYRVSDTRDHEKDEDNDDEDVESRTVPNANIVDIEHDQPKVHSINTSVDSHEGGDHADESQKPELAVPRRKPNMMLGNPMLIDELKKRQSTLHQTAE